MVESKKKFSLFPLINGFILIGLLISIIYPLYYLLTTSLSTFGGMAARTNPFMFTPAGFTLDAYKNFFSQEYIKTGYLITAFRTVVGTIAAVLFMSLAAYALSKRGLPGRKALTGFFLVNMFFGGGLIPTYLVIKSVGLLDNIWLLVLLPMFSTYYMLILRSYFSEIPESLEEAAQIDGAGELTVFFKIMMPLSVPALVTIATWMFFTHWNSWFDSMLYFQTMGKQVVQVHIRRLVIEQSGLLLSGVTSAGGKASLPTDETMRATGIMLTIVPVLLLYPFVKRFFVKGMTLGAVKG